MDIFLCILLDRDLNHILLVSTSQLHKLHTNDFDKLRSLQPISANQLQYLSYEQQMPITLGQEQDKQGSIQHYIH